MLEQGDGRYEFLIVGTGPSGPSARRRAKLGLRSRDLRRPRAARGAPARWPAPRRVATQRDLPLLATRCRPRCRVHGRRQAGGRRASGWTAEVIARRAGMRAARAARRARRGDRAGHRRSRASAAMGPAAVATVEANLTRRVAVDRLDGALRSLADHGRPLRPDANRARPDLGPDRVRPTTPNAIFQQPWWARRGGPGRWDAGDRRARRASSSPAALCGARPPAHARAPDAAAHADAGAVGPALRASPPKALGKEIELLARSRRPLPGRRRSSKHFSPTMQRRCASTGGLPPRVQ